VIFVDNISTLARTGRENEAESTSAGVGARAATRGRSVVFVHHAGKGGAQRGTSRREDVLDSVIALRRPQDYQADKARDSKFISRKIGPFTVTMPSPSRQRSAPAVGRCAIWPMRMGRELQC
jgi:hypothetical protein